MAIEKFQTSEVLKEEIQGLKDLRQEILKGAKKEKINETPDFGKKISQIVDELNSNKKTSGEVMKSFFRFTKEYGELDAKVKEWKIEEAKLLNYLGDLRKIALNLLGNESFSKMTPKGKAIILRTIFFDQINATKPLDANDVPLTKEERIQMVTYGENMPDPLFVQISEKILRNIWDTKSYPDKKKLYEDRLAELQKKRMESHPEQ